jgi:hypothetical protein
MDDDPEQHGIEHARRWSALGAELRRRLGPGTGLEPHVRGRFEGRLGGDLSGTMVHRSPLAGHVARAFGAQAVTAGEHVVGSADDLDPSTAAGTALLGHELTHVMQRDTTPDGEVAAQAIERELAADQHGPQPSGQGSAVDVDQLADRVYQRMVAEVLRDQDRGAWVA